MAPDPSVRNVEVIELAKEWTPAGKAKQENSAKKFYSESEEEEDSSDSSSDSESESEVKVESKAKVGRKETAMRTAVRTPPVSRTVRVEGSQA